MTETKKKGRVIKRTTTTKKTTMVVFDADGEARLKLKKSRSRGRVKPAMMSEHHQQAAYISWCRTAAEQQQDALLKAILRWIHAIPNGFLRTVNARLQAHAEGVVSGVHDIFIPAPQLHGGSGTVKRAFIMSRLSTPNFYGCYIEFKRPGEKMSENQERFAGYLQSVGYKTLLAFSWQEAARATVEYLALVEGTYPAIGESEIEVYRRLKREKATTTPKAARKPARRVALPSQAPSRRARQSRSGTARKAS